MAKPGDSRPKTPPSLPPQMTPSQQLHPAALSAPLGPQTTVVTCPFCGASVSTRVEKVVSTKTHIFALIFCVTGLVCCAVGVYICDCCKSTHHFCPNCNAFIGAFD